jgi:hypothetical protein
VNVRYNSLQSSKRKLVGEISVWLDPRRYEIVDDAMAEVLRAKTPHEKLSIAEGMWRMARDLIRDMVRHDHPEWTESEIAGETARRLMRGPG